MLADSMLTAVRSVIVATAVLVVVPAAPAHADTLVGDSGPRSLTIESSQLLTLPFVAATSDPSAPMAIALAPDGGFAVPASALSWQGMAAIPSMSFGAGTCVSPGVSVQSFSQSFALSADSDAPGLVDPAGGTAHVGADATLTAGDIAMHLSLESGGCLPGATATVACTFDTLAVHLDLDGDGAHGTDPAAGVLPLRDGSVAFPLTPSCSGGSALGDLVLPVYQWAAGYYGNIAGTLAVDAQMTPGARSPAAPVFQGTPALTGSPAVGGALTCTPPSVTGVPAPVVTIAWTRDGTPIPGAAGSGYVAQADDAGHAVACASHAANAFGTDDVASTGIVIARPQAESDSSTGSNPLAPPDPLVATSPGTQGQPAPARCVVPKLRGLRLTAAKRKLTSSHCRLGKLRKVKSKLKKGRVVKTKPRAGLRKPAGFRVALLVAR